MNWPYQDFTHRSFREQLILTNFSSNTVFLHIASSSFGARTCYPPPPLRLATGKWQTLCLYFFFKVSIETVFLCIDSRSSEARSCCPSPPLKLAAGGGRPPQSFFCKLFTCFNIWTCSLNYVQSQKNQKISKICNMKFNPLDLS